MSWRVSAISCGGGWVGLPKYEFMLVAGAYTVQSVQVSLGLGHFPEAPSSFGFASGIVAELTDAFGSTPCCRC